MSALDTGSWTRPVDGAGHWQHTAPHEPTFTDRLIPFVLCLLLGVVFTAAVVAGRAAMCELHRDEQGRPTIAYCPGWTPPAEGAR